MRDGSEGLRFYGNIGEEEEDMDASRSNSRQRPSSLTGITRRK